MLEQKLDLLHEQLGKLTEIVAKLADNTENLPDNVKSLNQVVGDMSDTLSAHIKHNFEAHNETGKRLSALEAAIAK